MNESPFPPEVPNIDEAVRITPVGEDYVPREYKFFCEESHVMSRFFAIDHADRKFIVVSLSGEKIRQIDFCVEHRRGLPSLMSSGFSWKSKKSWSRLQFLSSYERNDYG